MTQRPTNISATYNRVADNPYMNRVLRIVVPILSIAVSIFALLGIRGISAAAINDLNSEHEQGLARVESVISNTVDALALQLDSLQNDLVLQAYLSGVGDADAASRRGAELIDLHPDDYRSISYILLERSGQVSEPTVAFERRNISNRFSPVITETRPFEFADNNVFERAANSTASQIVIGDFRLADDRRTGADDVTVLLDLYRPIFPQDGASPVMVVHAVVDAQNLRGLVNLAVGDLVAEVPGRHIILVDGMGLGRVIADSGAIGDNYIRNLDAQGGNVITSNLYEQMLYNEDLVPDAAPDFNPVTQNIFSLTVPDFAPLQAAGWRVYMVDNGLPYFGTEIFINLLIGGLAAITSIGSVFLLRRFLTPILQPVYQADEMVQQSASGAPVTNIPGSPASQLVGSVQYITSQIDTLSSRLETQVSRHNRDLQVAGRIGREAAAQSDLDELARRAINLVCNELGFYHAQIFLLDSTRTVAVLRYSRGEAGSQLIAQGHQLAVGSDTVIGTVTADARPVIVNDTLDGGQDPHAFNPLLPDTRAEMGLPLIIGEQVIGAFDVQSRDPEAFQNEDLPTYQLLADQLAVAIYNAELRETTEERIAQIDRLNRQLTTDAWQELERRLDLKPHYGSDHVDGKLSAPITIRGAEIGRIEADLADQDFSQGDRQVLESVALRVALAIENARLFQESQISLAETSTLYQLSRQLNEADTLEDVLQAIIVSVAAHASGGQVWLFDENVPRSESRVVFISEDLPIMARPENPQLQNYRLTFDDYPLFQRLTAAEAYFLPDIHTEPNLSDEMRQLMQSVNAIAVAFVPLNMRGVWKGFISVTFAQPQVFEEGLRRVYNALVGQAGVAIDNRLLLQQTEDALARQEKLYAASRIINTSQSLADLVHAAVATSSDPSLDFWLALLQGERDSSGWPAQAHLVAQSYQGKAEETDALYSIQIAEDSPMRERDPQVVSVTDAGTPLASRMREENYQFAAIFPLFSENLPTALFYIVSKTPYELSAEDYEVYKALTGQMSTQIENRQLLQQTENTLTEIQRLYVASRAISSADNAEAIYDAVAGHLAMPFIQLSARTDREVNISLTILLPQPEPSIEASELELVYQWISDPTRTPGHAVGEVLDHDAVPVGMLIADNDDSLVRYDDLDDVPAQYPQLRDLLSDNESAAAAIAPLWSRQRWFGVLIVRTDRAELMDNSYARFMQSVADQVAVAIENQTLLNESLSQRQRLSDILAALPTGVLVLDPITMMPVQHNDQLETLLNRDIQYDTVFDSETYGLYRSGSDLLYPEEELPFYTARDYNMQMPPVDDVVVSGDMGITNILISAVPVMDDDGTQQAIVAVFQDVTTIRSMENTMQENLRETVMLYETQRAINDAEDQDELLDAVVGQLAMQQPADAFIILTQGKDEIRLARSLLSDIDDVYGLWPLLQEQIVTIDDINRMAEDEPEAAKVFEQLGVRSGLILPLQVRTRPRPMGWLFLVGDEPEAFTFDHERTLSSVADMVSQALDNTYLVRSTQEALTETASLYNANTIISRASDKYALFNAIESLLFNIRPDMYAGYLLTNDAAEEMFNVGFTSDPENDFDIRTLLQMPIEREGGIFIDDLRRTTLGEFENYLAQHTDVIAFAAINLRVKDKIGGRILIGYRQAHNFTESDERFLNTIADSASVVVDNQLLLEQIQSTLRETSVLYQASKALTDTSEPEDIADVIVNYLIEDHVTQVFIALLNTDDWARAGAQARVAASWHVGNDVQMTGLTLNPDEFPMWSWFDSEQVVTINDIDDPRYGLSAMEHDSLTSIDVQSLVIVPLRVPSRDIGVIWISSDKPFVYSDRDERIFQSFGEQTSLRLEQKRLVDQTNRRARQLQTSAIISQNVGQILDLDVLLPQVVDLIREQFGYDHVQVFLMDEDNVWANLVASTGEAGQQLLNVSHRLKRGSDSVIGSVTETGEPSIALDTADAQVVHKPNPFLPMTRSEMALPMIVKGEIVGALDVQSNAPNAFNDEDVQVLTLLASQIAVAIDNARLYENTQQSARDMAFLFDLTTDAAAAETLPDALDLIAFRVRDNLRADVAAIYLPQEYVDFNDNRKTIMEPEAFARTDSVETVQMPSIEVGDPEHLIGIATSAQQTQVVANIEREIRYTPMDAESRSAILAPIVSGVELVGLIVLESRRLAVYTAEATSLLQALAGSLAAIIQNTLLVDQLRSTNDKLREIDKLKSQFLANMSHELRTPLNSIIGFSRVMLKGIDGELTDMQEQDLTTIYNSGNHLLSLINDILDQAKIEANELNLKFSYFDVKPMVESVKSIAIGYMKDKPDLQLEVEIAPNLPQAYGDEFRSRQIMLNLVSNAIKFTTEGSVTLRVYAIMAEAGKQIRIDVIDSGIGIAEQDLPTVFEQFRQVDSSLTRTVGGTGLGLPISKSLAELQGGALTVASEVNVGSTFSVIIPTYEGAEAELERLRDDARQMKAAESDKDSTASGLIKREDVERAKARAEAEAAKSTQSSKDEDTQEFALNKPQSARIDANVTQAIPAIMNQKRDVILVEDNKDMVDQFRRVLQREGFEVTTAEHPSYAEAMVGQIRPSLVLLDVNFADGQGWDVLASLKERDDTFDIPIVVTTMSEDSERAYRLGAHTFLQRPFLPDDLLQAVLMAERESQRERILIIDDQPDAIRLLTELLKEHSDFKIFSAQSGDEGISLVARRRPDLIILDLRMPDKDGFAVLDELRGNPETAKIPVMIVTGDIDLSNSEQEALANIRVLPKADISQEEYEQFISNVRSYLQQNNGHNQ